MKAALGRNLPGTHVNNNNITDHHKQLHILQNQQLTPLQLLLWTSWFCSASREMEPSPEMC